MLRGGSSFVSQFNAFACVLANNLLVTGRNVVFAVGFWSFLKTHSLLRNESLYTGTIPNLYY